MALTVPVLQQWCQELNKTISISSFLFSSLLLLLLVALNFFKGNKKLNLPPSPPRLPVIGHMHLLGTLPYKSLHALSQTYGSLSLLVYLGSAPTLVVASAEMAKEIMKTQDVTFANRLQTS
ncbi:hypothetical protein RHGRI_024431 [Rhododendron griersonianum]|uniref:Uncharacterized protein n=1 Tax=Rhododendron griersonianum TaxID=479676 RepID=A0AAV6J9I1_9ERIC|nr:hypothetical protein RHGRI_024431 [Rhododendron griersonianum]